MGVGPGGGGKRKRGRSLRYEIRKVRENPTPQHSRRRESDCGDRVKALALSPREVAREDDAVLSDRGSLLRAREDDSDRVDRKPVGRALSLFGRVGVGVEWGSPFRLSRDVMRCKGIKRVENKPWQGRLGMGFRPS